LKATLSASELASVADVPTDSVDAYDLYLQAKRFAIGETRIGYQTALELYKEALKIDPEFALAWVGLAHAHITNYWVYGGDLADRELAREAIDHAKSIDSSFPELFMAEGSYWYWGFLDYQRALYNLEKAIDQMPGNAEAHMWRGWASRRAGHWEDAISSMQQSLRLNPRVAFNWIELGTTFFYLLRYEEARKALEQANHVAPDHFWTKTALADFVLLESGNVQLANRLTAGAQHTGDIGFVNSYIRAKIFDDAYEEALEVSRGISDDMEIERQQIRLRESRAAEILHFMGRVEDSISAARAGIFRLQALHQQLGEDYRIDLAEARLFALRGDSPEAIRAAVSKAMDSRPADIIEEFNNRYEHSRSYAMAGMTVDCIASLEPLFTPPSAISIPWVELDPAFDRIRDDPDFAAMIERHR